MLDLFLYGCEIYKKINDLLYVEKKRKKMLKYTIKISLQFYNLIFNLKKF